MSDIIFSIYKYEISQMQGVQLDAFDKEVRLKPLRYATKELFFESFLPEKGKTIDLWKAGRQDKKGVDVLEKDSHKNIVVAHQDNIIVMSVQANKVKKINEEDWTVRGIDDHPPFYILIDNRPGHQYLAIQNAAMDTDDSAKMLMNSLHHELQEYGYRFEIMRLKKNLPFMDALYYIKDRLQDNIRKVTFDFDQNLKERKKLPSKFVHALKEWIGQFADSGQITANISDDKKLSNETVKQDLELMAELCSTNAKYNLTVKFEHFGLYRYGKDVRAQFGLNSTSLEEFISKGKEETKDLFDDVDGYKPRITLPQWFDNGIKIYEGYEKEALSVKRRRRTHRL